jgi:hypothetical protein
MGMAILFAESGGITKSLKYLVYEFNLHGFRVGADLSLLCEIYDVIATKFARAIVCDHARVTSRPLLDATRRIIRLDVVIGPTGIPLALVRTK